MKSIFSFLFLISFVYFSNAQSWLYVSAENGLFARDQPNMASNKIVKLNYGTKVEVVKNTDLNMDVLDSGKKISGQWVKINAYVNYFYVEGYVFNGYLTEEVLIPRYNITFDTFEVLVEDLNLMNHALRSEPIELDTIKFAIELGNTPENKMLFIKPFVHYKKVEVYQSYETSVTIMNEGPHCDLVNWKHYRSDWFPVKFKGNNSFQTCSYSKEDWEVFVDINMADLIEKVRNQCGDPYAEMIKNIRSVNEYPSGVSISTIYLKVILIDLDDNLIEKIIAIEMPMGC